MLVVPGSADCRPVGSPLNGACRVYTLGINVIDASAAARVLPGDDSSTIAIGADLVIELAAGGGADCRPIVSPLRDTTRAYPLGIDVLAGAARVIPGDDGSTSAIRADFGKALAAAGSADCRPVVSPLRDTSRVYLLGINVIAAALVLPGDDSSTSAVGTHYRIFLITAGGRDWHIHCRISRPG